MLERQTPYSQNHHTAVSPDPCPGASINSVYEWIGFSIGLAIPAASFHGETFWGPWGFVVSRLINERAETSRDLSRHTPRPLVCKLLRIFATGLPSACYPLLTHLQDKTWNKVTVTEESDRMQNCYVFFRRIRTGLALHISHSMLSRLTHHTQGPRVHWVISQWINKSGSMAGSTSGNPLTQHPYWDSIAVPRRHWNPTSASFI